jgi:hypothetical protein
VHTYEEPTLREAYGPTYEEFCENVPRWLPRLRPWRGATRRNGDRIGGRAGEDVADQR